MDKAVKIERRECAPPKVQKAGDKGQLRIEAMGMEKCLTWLQSGWWIKVEVVLRNLLLVLKRNNSSAFLTLPLGEKAEAFYQKD